MSRHRHDRAVGQEAADARADDEGARGGGEAFLFFLFFFEKEGEEKR